MSARCAGGVALIGGLFFKVCAVMSIHVLTAVYTDGAYYCWCGRDGSALVQHLKGCAEIWGRNVEEEHSRYRGARKQYLFRLQEIVAGERG